ncbi:extracellular solute-binding protein [Paenibacillus methanolicus]|uniref:Putative aldouronate transport system substrate-binding protein n=1 Tax=Paenibacillus methanolicus TaxID=582686 RepID=A0A5S5CJB3_9BACL|nr:extracellular solute-binding protein [Paenibacillus methanolicus]TYP79830.1 putative aldouronate transport system substrate-binding protein [Paenibacillus methanolicus]
MRMLRVTGIILLIAVFTSMSVACSEPNEVGTEVNDLRAPSEPMPISIAYWDIKRYFDAGDAVLRKIEHDLDIDLQPVQVSRTDYAEKFKVWAATDKLPDVFAHTVVSESPGLYADWIKQNLIRPLPDDLSPYPYVYELSQIPDTRALRHDNKLHMLPRIAYPTNDLWMLDRVVFIRKDWMSELAMPDPLNFEQFQQSMRRFADEDPDRNGQRDTVGLTAAGLPYLAWVFSPAFPQFGVGQWVQEDNEWIPYYASKQMSRVVDQYDRLQRSGGLDAEFFLLKEDDATEKFAQGRAGALAYKATPDSLSKFVALWNKYNPDADFYDAVKIMRLWPAQDGNRYYYVAPTYWSESYFSAKVDEAKMDRILRLYDYLLSPVGMMLMRYGIEGQDYVMQGEEIVITRPLDEKTGKPVSIQKLYPSTNVFQSLASWGMERTYRLDVINKINYGERNIQAALEEMRWLLNHAVAVPFSYSAVSLSTPSKDKLSAAIAPLEDLTQAILSEGDPQQLWQATLAKYEAMGLRESIKEVNGELK